ncbi:hypothetical protein BGX33_006965 [Mortierella sp. NVP41]|nr:hypothetical protein BGX33_006965 [Mortierella sp. NVP41]
MLSEDKAEVAVIDFAASLCEGLGSDFVMPPSYFDQHNLNIAFEDAYPRPVPEMMSKAAVPSPPSSPPSPRSLGSPRSIRGQVSLNDRSSKSSSIYSTDSDSSVSLTDSDSSDSDSDSDSDSSLSPVSGASFFSSVPTTPAPTPVPMPASVPKSSNFSAALMKSGGIKIPSSLMTLLPSGSTKSKTIPASPSTTPPVSPPLAHVEAVTKQMANGPFGRPPPGVVTGLADPRAMIVKRLAYIHTLRKLREREKRPFRHAVLLHLVLLQLRRGLTNRHCGEVAEFYVAMSATQFPPRLEIASAMMMAQQQRTKLQQQQQMLSQPLLSQIPVPSPASSTIESVQESMIPVRSSSKTTPIPVTGTSGDKGPKSKRSLVFSLQSRKAQNSTAGSSSNNESGWSFTSPSSAAATTSIPPSQISAFKDRLPLLQIPTYPLINLEKNTSNSVLTSLPIRKSLAAATYSSDDDHGIEDGNVDFQPGMVQPAPTVILPKKTTGRKGLLYQQQLQLRMRQQMPTMMGGNSGAGQMPLAPGMTEQDLMLLQSQLTGARPRFATSTFTTVRTGRSEVVTRPLVTVASVKVSPAIKATIPADIPSSSSWNSFPFGSFSHRSYQNGATATATSATTMTTSAATTSASQDGNGSLPAGLLTPPLSPLFRNPFSTVTPSPTATTATMPLATTMGSVKSSDTLSYNSNTTINAPSNFNSSIPPPLPPSATPTTNANISMRSSYAVQGQHSPTSSHHIRGTSAGVVSSFKLPHIQNSHHTISYLEGQAVHARSRNVNETTGLHHPFPLTRKVSGGILTHKQIQHQLHPGLPSPPLSPTLDTEGNATAMVSTGSARHSLPQRSLLSSGYAHVHHGHGVVMPSSGVNNINSNGGRSENIAWITRSPSPGSQHEIQSRQSMEDMRSRRQWRISLPSPPLPASAIAAAPVPVGRMSMKKKSSSSKGGAFIPGVGGGEESEEEDVPLAFVQRRISSETLRLLA